MQAACDSIALGNILSVRRIRRRLLKGRGCGREDVKGVAGCIHDFFWNHNVISTESVSAQCMKRRGVQFLDGGRAPY